MERDTAKLWRLARALNDEGTKGQKITLEEDAITLTERKLQMRLQEHTQRKVTPTSQDNVYRKSDRKTKQELLIGTRTRTVTTMIWTTQ